MGIAGVVVVLSELLATCLVGGVDAAARGFMHTFIMCFGVACSKLNALWPLSTGTAGTRPPPRGTAAAAARRKRAADTISSDAELSDVDLSAVDS